MLKQNPRKILIFSLAYYPHVGGAEVAIKEITERISDFDFHMVTMRFSSADKWMEKIGNVTVHRVGIGGTYISKIFYVPLAAIKGFVLYRKEKIDASWAMMSYMVFPLVLMRMCGTKIPYVLNLQDGDPFERVFRRWFIRPFLGLLKIGFKNAAVIQTISIYLANWAKEIGYKGRIEVIPQGADIKKFTGNFIPHEGVVLITTSRLVHKNALDDVIRALPLLPLKVKFQILGTGPDEDFLKNLAKEMGVINRVEFLGHVDHKIMPTYLHKADIFVRPSRTEGFGISFVEAFAAGLPVIATQEGGIADFLFDAIRNPDKPTTGWAVDKDNPEQIAEAVKEVLRDPEQTKRVVETARKLAFEKYDWDLIAKDMGEKVFDKILENGKKD